MATRPAIVEGDRNVLITAPTNNAVIVTGDRNTVEMRLDAPGAVLAFAFRWNRPRPRKRRDRPTAPPRFERHVDRDAEVLALAGDDPPRVVNLYGDAGIGKTHVLVEALHRRESEMRDGTVYVDARERDADDLLHAAFEALFECRIPLRDLQIERHLDDRRALLAFENVELSPDRTQRLALAAPECRILVTSRERILYDGVPLRIEGLAPEHAVAIAEQELGRPLSGRERAVAESVAAGLRGNPLRLRQMFSRARDAGLALEQLAPRAASAYDRANALPPDEREVARTLAVHRDAPLGVEHIEALAGDGAAGAAAMLEARHEARSHSPRYSLAGGMADAFDDDDLGPEIDRALEHFTAWAEAETRTGRREGVLLEAAALLALLERAHAAGRAEEVVRLGLAIEGALAWGNRWAAWRRVLELVLEAARERGDTWAEGMALHQLGTRAYCVGDVAGATRMLEQALALRERIGDVAGTEATWQNLRVVGHRAPLPYRLSHVPLTILAAIVAVLVAGAGGAAGAGLLSGGGNGGGVPGAATGSGGERSAVAGARDAGGGAPGATGGGGRSARLLVAVDGPGSVNGGPPAIRCRPRCDAAVDVGARIVLLAQPDRGARFRGWAGGACRGTGACRLTVRRDTRVAARFVELPAPQSLAVTVAGSGSVVSRPAAISCPGTCDGDFDRGRIVVLSAMRAAGTRFTGWTGACYGTRPRCAVRMDRAQHVGAGFEAVSPRPARERRLGAPTTTVVPPVDRRVRDERRLIQVIVDGSGHGRVTSSPAGLDCSGTCLATFRRGEVVTLAATADAAWRFAGWTGAGCTGTDDCVVTIAGFQSVVARFEPRPTYTLTTQAVYPPEGYMLQATGESDAAPRDCQAGCAFVEGTRVEVRASPDAAIWDGCDDAEPAACRITMTGDRTVIATFGESEYYAPPYSEPPYYYDPPSS